MNVLTIQSAVTFGHVGNGAAVFVLQRLGHAAWPMATVQLAHHPAHGRWRGRVTPAEELLAIADALEERGLFAHIDAVLTGYLADAAQGPVVAAIAARVKRANPKALWALDPVIGDNGRVFVKPGIAEFLRDHAAPGADLLTPNAFELGVMTGRPVATPDDALAAARQLCGGAPSRTVVATGLRLDGARDRIVTLAVRAGAAWSVATPLVDHPGHGTGDSFMALFLGHVLNGCPVDDALGRAASGIHGVLRQSLAAAPHPAFGLELRLVAAQDELVAPSRRFTVERLA